MAPKLRKQKRKVSRDEANQSPTSSSDRGSSDVGDEAPSESSDFADTRPTKKPKLVLKTVPKATSLASKPPAGKGSKTYCQNDRCGVETFDRNRVVGPNGSATLCQPCGHAYRAALKKANGDKTKVDDSWKDRKRIGKLILEKGEHTFCQNDRCGVETLAGNRTIGPNGPSTLCHPCGKAYSKALKKAGGDKTKVDDSWKDRKRVARISTKEGGSLFCQNDRCGEEISTGARAQGPDGPATLCPACGASYSRALKEAGGDETKVDDSWKDRKRRVRGGRACQNEICGNLSGARMLGPNGPGTLCPPCGEAYSKALKEAGGDQTKVNDSWKKSERSEQDDLRFEHTCRHCGRHESEEWDDDLCNSCDIRQRNELERRPHTHTIQNEPSRSHTSIQHIAYREWRLMYPETRKPPSRGSNLWYQHVDIIKKELTLRNLGSANARLKERAINVIQLDDAYNGILPRPRPAPSDLHQRDHGELRRRAYEAGYPRSEPQTTDAFLKYLQDRRDATDDLNKIKEERLHFIRSAVQAVVDKLRADGKNVTHESHNGGIVGSELALARLHTVLARGHYPTWTSGDLLLCGPRALAESINAIRREYFGKMDGTTVYSNPVTMDLLMSLLFENAEDAGQHGAIGIPTENYMNYIRNTFGHLPDVEFNNEYTNMTRLNNMDFQQLIAMVVLARRADLIEEEFSLAVVRSSTEDDQGNYVPALAQIVHEGEHNAGTVFLHHNMGLSDDEYSHWEAFSDPTEESDFDVAHEWGLNSLVTSEAPALLNQSRRVARPAHSHEEKLDELRRKLKNAALLYKNYKNAYNKACLPCRAKGKHSSCARKSGHKYCDNCEDEPSECLWETGSMESRIQEPKQASELTDADLEVLILPMKVQDEQEQMLRTGQHLPDPYPESSHFLAIGCARKSSHPGAATMMQVMQNLIHSLGIYDNMLGGPHYPGTAEGQRPGGPGTHMHSHRVVIARHGGKPIPTHLGNVHDPALQAFINLINVIIRPNNPNLPIEIHFVLMGFAGFSVDVSGWGDRTHGFFRHILDADAANGTNIASSIYLVPLIEHFVVDPLSPTSINQGIPPHGIRLNNKQIIKYRLADVIDRREELVNHAATLGIGMQEYMRRMRIRHQGLVHYFVPPFWLGGAQEQERLDRFVMAMYWEKAWRSGWLDGNTTPTDAMVSANDVNRNNPL